MSDAERRELTRRAFDAAAEGYDRPSLRFFVAGAERLVAALPLAGDETALDIATGTGAVALALARRLPRGRVVGVDLSEGMLRRAAAKAAAQGLDNVTFQAMDMAALDLPPERFDLATAACALFFAEDMAACLAGILSHVRPGGRVAASGFSAASFSPHVDLFLACAARHGLAIPALGWRRLGDEERNRALFAAAGLEDIEIFRHALGYPLADPEAWWEVLWYAGFRSVLNQLDAAGLARFRAEHLAEIARLAREGGATLQVEGLFALGRKPART